MTNRRTALLAVLLLVAALPVRAAEAPDYKTPNKDWARGPVRWLLTAEEEKDWKTRRTDEDRAKFVKDFWAKRDPTPGTPDNEYEIDFWKRVEAADKNFKAYTKPGSLTDRGRVFILLGVPTKTATDALGRSIWSYDLAESSGATKHMDLRFTYSDTGGSWMLLDHKEVDAYVAAHSQTRGFGWKVPVPAEPVAESAPAAAARPAAEDTSPESQRQIPILQAALSGGPGPTDVPFQVTYDFFAAVDGTTLTAISVETPRDAAHGSGDVALLPFARIVPAAAEGKPLNLTGSQPFVAAPLADNPPGSFVYQTRHNLAPGAYTIAVVLEDRVVKGKMGTLVQPLQIPDFRAKEFGLNGITLLAKFERIDTSLGPDEKERGAGPFVVGSFRLVPRASAVLQKDEALSFYYQVYNPAPDPATGKFLLEATYSFFLKDGATWKPFRKPIVKMLAGQVELYSIDLKDFLIPNQKLPADFKMDVQVVDKVTSKETKREVAFAVR